MNVTPEHGQRFQCRVTSEAVPKSKINEDVKDEEVDSSELESFEPKNKILIQRVFHQPTPGVVEEKLDYVLAKSDEEITKHVFGGLFKTRYYAYRPENYCLKHDQNLFEHTDETLLKLGDKFDSLQTFRLYVDSHAKQWKYYLKCADSHVSKSTYVYKCVFARSGTGKYFDAKGLRKRTEKVPKGNCPCRILLKPVSDSSSFTVVYVCNHHDHELSDECFNKLQHGRRIHPSAKEEIMDLLSLDVDREIVKKYFETLTGYKMENIYFNNLLAWMKKNNVERQISLEKLKEMSKKIEKIKEEMGIADTNAEENVDNDFNLPDKASQIQEAINVLRTVTTPRKPQQKVPPRNPTVGRKRPKIMRKQSDEDPYFTPPVNKSRLEARLQELTYDHETLQSIKHLQDSVRGEADEWPAVQNEVEPWNKNITGHRKKRIRNPQKHTPIEPKLEPQTVVIENTQNIDGFEENQNIIYENELTVMETQVENGNDIVVYENHDERNGTEIVNTDNEVAYCIQYEDNNGTVEQTDQQYILIENLENIPEVHIQATDLATVSIGTHNGETKPAMEVDHDQTNTESVDENLETPNISQEDTTLANDNEIKVVEIPEDNITVLGNIDPSIGLETDAVYEVINTDDRKIFPDREFVRKVILKKEPKKSKKGTPKFNNVGSLTESNGSNERPDYLDRLISDLVKDKDLESLECDDEYYMVVVDDEDDDAAEDISVDYEKSKTKEEFESCVKSVLSNTLDKNVQCNFVSTKDIDREMKIIGRLKRMRKSLERDIKTLVATKDELVKEIMKAKRSKVKHQFYG